MLDVVVVHDSEEATGVAEQGKVEPEGREIR